MRRAEQQILRVRRETENEDFSDSNGIVDEEFLGYLNDAQDRVYAEIVKQHPKFYMNQLIDNVPVNVEAYQLPTQIYLGQIALLEFSTTGDENDYYRIKRAELQERLSYRIGFPQWYIRRNKEILFAPIPASGPGTIRLTYIKRLPKIDVRRGIVESVSTTSTALTAITLDVNSSDTPIDLDAIEEESFFCVVSRDGDLKMAGIEFDSIDSNTGVVTLTGGSHTFSTGESVAADDYVVRGEYTYNKSELQDITERYLISHLRFEILDRDSNDQGTRIQDTKMERLLTEIMGSFADEQDDVIEPAILDAQFFIDDNFY